MAFEVELTLEGVVDRLDPLPDPADRAVPGRLVAAVRADQSQPEPGGDTATSRSPILGSARHQATGIPSGVVIRYSFSPQYQRECAAQ